jgi:hypothetical protein
MQKTLQDPCDPGKCGIRLPLRCINGKGIGREILGWHTGLVHAPIS